MLDTVQQMRHLELHDIISKIPQDSYRRRFFNCGACVESFPSAFLACPEVGDNGANPAALRMERSVPPELTCPHQTFAARLITYSLHQMARCLFTPVPLSTGEISRARPDATLSAILSGSTAGTPPGQTAMKRRPLAISRRSTSRSWALVNVEIITGFSRGSTAPLSNTFSGCEGVVPRVFSGCEGVVPRVHSLATIVPPLASWLATNASNGSSRSLRLPCEKLVTGPKRSVDQRFGFSLTYRRIASSCSWLVTIFSQ